VFHSAYVFMIVCALPGKAVPEMTYCVGWDVKPTY